MTSSSEHLRVLMVDDHTLLVESLSTVLSMQGVATVRPELAQWGLLNDAVAKALAKEKEKRFQSVAEFREALLDAIAKPGVASATAVPTDVAEWSEEAPAPLDSSPSAAMPADDFFASMGGGAVPVARPPVNALLAPFASTKNTGQPYSSAHCMSPLRNTVLPVPDSAMSRNRTAAALCGRCTNLPSSSTQSRTRRTS